jgi:hypothetical protein
VSAARRYQEVIAGLDAAADALRERDRERASELARLLVDLDDAMVRAVERAALTRLGVDLHWETALESLWTESWLKLRPLPDPPAAPGDLAALDAAVDARSAELQDAVRRRRFGLPGR